MFDLNKSYGFDPKRADVGVKMTVGPDPETDYVLLKKMPNSAYRAKMNTVMMSNRKMLEILKAQDPEAHEKRDNELLCEIMAETVLVGWGPGFTDGAEPIPYSVEAAKNLLIKYPAFKGDCLDFAANNINYQPTPDINDIKKK